jgi:UDP-GlcNAc:undecaprenyl-phosphate GlcNAc-1-phosphate transferase
MFLVAVCVLVLLVATLLSALLTWLVRSIARKNRWVKGPESDRHVHSRPVPRLGGIAVYLTFATIILCEIALVSFGLHLQQPESARLLLRILMPATLMFFVGLADDFFGLRASLKLGIQIIAGFWLFNLGCSVGVVDVKIYGTDCTVWVSCAATVAWVVMLSNAFNLIDGLDGLAAGSSVFPLLTFCAVALFHHNGQMGVASLILTGALLGFLRFNFNPATIFLGDCGSLFLGFMLAALSLAGSEAKAPTLLSVALPVVACGFPLAETFVSVIRRFLSGRPIFSADREHFHHRLLKLGFTHRQVVVLLFGVSGICSLMSVMLLYPKLNVLIVVGMALSLLIFIGVGKLGYPEFEEIGRLILRVREQKLVIARNVKIRQIATALKQVRTWEEVSQVLREGLCDGEFAGFEFEVYWQGEYKSYDDELAYSRTITFNSEPIEIQWSLSLQFADAQYSGHLELMCPYRESSLKMDVNVLLQVLQPALCRACRNIGSEVLMMEDARLTEKRAAGIA